ncbi:solute carrier family 31 (copper transporter), member 1 [Blastomyces parvus]|uniref:Copper transport protein n=1 Tax=Blastomyces parvus TaxID=2060905 RepID=A0A2B7X900_9EURO|nr:solute carrier family 31 (copper transporter), member 1 [Blastomyces parvus]
MDHSMHQAGMDHGHGDMDMGDQCSMNMHFTFSSHNLCIIFKQWRITGPFSLLLSLVAIALLTAGYEGVRALARRYETRHALALKDGTISPGGRYAFDDETPDTIHGNDDNDNVLPTSNAPLLSNNTTTNGEAPRSLVFAARTDSRRRGKLVLAAFYAVQVFYSFMIM